MKKRGVYEVAHFRACPHAHTAESNFGTTKRVNPVKYPRLRFIEPWLCMHYFTFNMITDKRLIPSESPP